MEILGSGSGSGPRTDPSPERSGCFDRRTDGRSEVRKTHLHQCTIFTLT